MWALFEAGELTADSELSGLFKDSEAPADVDSVLEEIKAVFAEEQLRQQLKAEAEDDF